MVNKHKLNQNSSVKTFITTAMVAVAICLFSPVPALADTIDTTRSQIAFSSVSDFASGLSGTYKNVFLKLAEKVNIANNKKSALKRRQDELQLLRVGFNSIKPDSNISTQALLGMAGSEDDDIEPAVIGKALVFPNPFRQNSETGAELGYRLSKDMDLEIHVYNMFSQRILKRTFNAGVVGARKGYNKLNINQDTLDGEVLSAGVYFYLLIHNGKVLSRGKMAVKP
jgi:hypothetical protein